MKLPLLVLLVLLTGCSVEDTSYEDQWNENFHPAIAKTLAQNKIRDCSEFIFKRNLVTDGQFLVHCTADGTNWSEYVVWTNINEVEGPFPLSYDEL